MIFVLNVKMDSNYKITDVTIVTKSKILYQYKEIVSVNKVI